MKLFGFTLATVAVAQYNNTFVPAAAAGAARSYGVEPEYAAAATCYKCEGNNYVDCIAQANLREGGAISCPADKICSITERRRGGELERVEMRCKNEDVCKLELKHNLRPCPQMTWVTECHQMERDGKLISHFLYCKILVSENGAEVPSVCRKCFPEEVDIEYINSFIDEVRYGDYVGDNGLPVAEWMSPYEADSEGEAPTYPSAPTY